MVQRMSFDAWGKRRETNWQPMGLAAIENFNTDITTRGFTGHEQIDSVGLIHMNGRVYDAELGRFLSADPNVQALDNLQNFNRYSYVLNNPLSYTDPTGFFFAKLFKAIGKAFGKIFSAIGRAFKKLLRSPIFRAIIQIVACAGPQSAVTCALAAGAMAKAAGGSMGDVLKAMAFSFISRGVWKAVGTIANVGKIGMALIHGAVNGALTVAQGGNFLVGFASGVIGKATSFISDVISQGDMLLDTIIVAASGCGTAVLAGGSCANGAISAAFANMYNKWSKGMEAMYQQSDMSKTREEFELAISGQADDASWIYDFIGLGGAVKVGVAGVARGGVDSVKAGVKYFNPFKGKSADEIHEMFVKKGFDVRGPDAKNGYGGYVNIKNNRSYHIDMNNSFNEPPHVDVNRLRTYKGPLNKRKFGIW